MRSLTLLLFSSILIFFISSCGEQRQRPVFEYSYENPAEVGSRYSNFYQDSEGRIYMSWLTGIEEDFFSLQYTTYFEDQWTMPRTIKTGTDFFVNWADFPSIVGQNREAVAAHWLKKVEGGTYAYDVNVAFSADDGFRTSEPITPHTDGTPTEHGFVSMEPIDDDRVLAIWLDGRETEGRAHDSYEDYDMGMTLRSAEISSSGEISRSRVIDQLVCDCCQTDMAPVNDGFVAVYRNRSESEIRDISIVRYNAESGEWSDPNPVAEDGWEIRACPVNGPRVVANGDRVAVAWYTEADDQPRVQLALSSDGGLTFNDPIVIADQYAIGRVDLLLSDEGSVFVSWMDRGTNHGLVMIKEIRPDGEIGPGIHVGTTSSSRASGFPRMKQTGNNILVTWTQTEPHLRVRTALVPISDFTVSNN